MNRQERRVRLKKSVDAVRHGMDLDAGSADQLWSMIGLTRVLIDMLEGRGPMRASEAARRAHEFFEISLKRNPSNFKIECGAGCAFCCHMRVTALAPEIFLVANYIRRERKAEAEDVLARMRIADTKSRGWSARERPKQKAPCGLLENNNCSVYSARPSSCRGLTSISVKTCEQGFNGEEVDVQTPAVWTELRGAHNQAMWAALSAAGLPVEVYELNHAVRVALENPDGEARWLAGEDVFAGVSCDNLLDAPGADSKKRSIGILLAGATGKEMI